MQERKNEKSGGCELISLVVFGIVLFLLYLAKPNIQGSRIASNEATAIASLKAIANAQSVFIKYNLYKTRKNVYANSTDGRGISDLYEVGYDGSNATDNAHKTLDRTVASADDSNPDPIPKGGYFVRDLKCDDYTKQFAVLAYPAEYNITGRNVFVINETGEVYQIDAANKNAKMMDTYKKITPIDKYPTADELKNWIPAGR